MVVEVTNFPFLHERTLEEYIKTLQTMSGRPFAAIACDQGSHRDYEEYNALKYALDLIHKELDVLKEQKKALYEELSSKYGVKGIDFVVTMDGSVITDGIKRKTDSKVRKTSENVDCEMITNWRMLGEL